MASLVDDPVEKLQEEVSCSICLEYLREPVTIDCGHNFCQACISDYCKQGAGSTTGAALCPQCRVGFLLSNSRPNKQLANIVEGIERLARRPSQGLVEALCEKHGKKLRLFCQDDGESICLVCDKSREHHMHSVLPIEEAAQDYKVRRELGLDSKQRAMSKNRLGFFAYPNPQSSLTREALGQLCMLNPAYLIGLLNSNFLLEQCVGLQNLITEMEHKCQKPAAILGLQEAIAAQKGAQAGRAQPLPSSIFICGGLQEAIMAESGAWKGRWQRHHGPVLCCFQHGFVGSKHPMCQIQPEVSVTFDPDTANPYLLLSEDLLSVQVVDQRQDLPKSSSRFETCTCLMGHKQFTFGKHYWVVCVEGKSSWTLGVCKESVSRQGIFTPSPATGFWTIWLRNGDEYAALTSPLTELVVRAKPKLVGIFLDYDAGEVSFYNSNTGSHIFTFLDSFSETLRPYFYPGIRAGGLNDAPLIIQPATGLSGFSLKAFRFSAKKLLQL
uniref:Uncharacterized protein n=1 Tax=Laticauda laticaudata TaxID=8630 RepID=A0A8C5SW66_LATLA